MKQPTSLRNIGRLMACSLALLGLLASPAANAQVITNPDGTLTLTQDVSAGGPINLGANIFDFVVSSLSGSILNVDIQISIVHPVDFDLVASLTSPTGKRVKLFDAVTPTSDGGGNFQDTYISDNPGRIGESRIGVSPNITSPFTGPAWAGGVKYQPQYYGNSPAPSGTHFELAWFNGESPNGTWHLTITDQVGEAGNRQLFKSGEAAPWGTADGTKLIITTTPEPQTYAMVAGLGLVAFAAIRRKMVG